MLKMYRRRPLVVSAALVILSIAGLVTALAMPAETKPPPPPVSYEHSGTFDYVVTLKPSHLFGPEPQAPTPPAPAPPPLSNLVYPADQIGRFTFNFDYRLTFPGTTRGITAYMEIIATGQDLDGNDTRLNLVPLVYKAAPFSQGFELVMTDAFAGGDIGIDILVYPTIQTDSSGPIFDLFEQKLTILRKGRVLELNRTATPLERADTAYHGSVSYTQDGKVSYSVLMKAGSPYGAVVPPSTTPPPAPKPPPPLPPATLKSGDIIPAKLIDRMDGTFAYKFMADKPITQTVQEVKISAIFDGAKVWSKNIVLLPATKQSGDFKVKFPVDMGKLMETIAAISSETGVGSDKLTIRADVRVTGRTEFGPIDDVFSPTLSTTLGKDTLEWAEKLTQTKSGSLGPKAVASPNKFLGARVGALRTMFILMLLVFLAACLSLVAWYRRSAPALIPAMEKEARQTSKKYKERIAEATGQMTSAADKTISMGTMEDLIKIADELGKPVIHQSAGKPNEHHAYCVFDGATCYRYVLGAGGTDNPGTTEKSGLS